MSYFAELFLAVIAKGTPMTPTLARRAAARLRRLFRGREMSDAMLKLLEDLDRVGRGRG